MQQWFPLGASSYAADVDNLIIMITLVTGVWLLLAEGVLLYLIVRFRRKPGVPAGYVTGEKRNQLAWVLVPCFLILLCDLVIDHASAEVWDRIKIEQPPQDLKIRVEGRQWSWTLTHPGLDNALGTEDDLVLVNEIHVPVNATVHFDVGAADVLHSFFLPEMRLKQDAVPGRWIPGWFRPTRPGTYSIICAELCGVAHGVMRGTLTVDTPEAYRAWLASQTGGAVPAETPVAAADAAEGGTAR